VVKTQFGETLTLDEGKKDSGAHVGAKLKNRLGRLYDKAKGRSSILGPVLVIKRTEEEDVWVCLYSGGTFKATDGWFEVYMKELK
jgi:hypothetical protein